MLSLLEGNKRITGKTFIKYNDEGFTSKKELPLPDSLEKVGVVFEPVLSSFWPFGLFFLKLVLDFIILLSLSVTQ